MKLSLHRLTRYNPSDIINDAIAGLTVGLVAIPQAFIFASLAGVPIEYAMYSALLGSIAYSILGSNKYVILNSSHLFLGLIFMYVWNCSEWIPQKAIVITFVCGVGIALAGVLSVATLVNRLSSYVLAGFIWATTLTIGTMELYHMMGIKYTPSHNFRFVLILLHIKEAHLWDVALSIGCLLIILSFRALRIIKVAPEDRKPSIMHKMIEGILEFLSNISAILILVLAALVAYCLSESDSPFTLAAYQNFKPELPNATLPPLSTITTTSSDWRITIMTPILAPAIAILGHASVIRALSTEEETLTGLELFSVGVINLVGSFFCCAPLAADFSCSSVNSYYGARSRLAGFLSGVVIVLFMTGVTTPFHMYIPRAAVSSVTIFGLIHLTRGITLAAARENEKAKIVAGIATFTIGLFFSLEYGLLVGIILDITISAFMSQKTPVIVEKLQSPAGNYYILVSSSADTKLPTVKMFQEAIARNEVLSDESAKYMPVVIDCKHITLANLNAAHGVNLLMDFFRNMKTTVIFHNMNPDVAKAFSSIFPADFLHATTESHLRRLFRAMRIESEMAKLRTGNWDQESQTQGNAKTTEDTNC